MTMKIARGASASRGHARCNVSTREAHRRRGTPLPREEEQQTSAKPAAHMNLASSLGNQNEVVNTSKNAQYRLELSLLHYVNSILLTFQHRFLKYCPRKACAGLSGPVEATNGPKRLE